MSANYIDLLIQFNYPATGHVTEFDPASGLGRIKCDQLDYELSFHAISLLDGTRTVDPGTAVCFLIKEGPKDVVTASEILKIKKC